MARTPLTCLLAALALVVVVLPGAARAAEPASGTVTPEAPTTSWQGDTFPTPVSATGECPAEEDPTCDVYQLLVEPGAGAWVLDVVTTAAAAGDLFVLVVRDEAGQEVGRSMTASSTERVTVEDPAGTYTIEVLPLLVSPGATYAGEARLSEVVDPPTPDGPDSVLHEVDPDAPVASARVPLRVVAVGFEAGELDADAILAEVPTHQRPATLFERGGGLRSGDVADVPGLNTLVNHGRIYYDQEEPLLLPIEFEWEPELIHAPSAFADGLFAHMVANSHTGTHAGTETTAYLEHYNLTRGSPYRIAAGGSPVAPGSEVLFVDGEATEDWIAEHSEALLGFHAGRDPGESGYTVFLLNTWDSPEALAHFPADTYHHFFIDRTDPDTGAYRGIDWGRIWGGRYRFMMVDLGAAPNPWESETFQNPDRTVLGSAAYDPPLWEYRAGAPRVLTPVHLADGTTQAVTPGETWDAEQLHAVLARTVNQAIGFRFLHATLYEPHPGTGRFWLSDNLWHDAGAEIPWASDLEALYDQETALRGLRTLTPYLEFDGDVVHQYLAETDEHPEYAADQAALDQAKQDGTDVGGVAHTAMSTVTMMDYLDANPERFLRGGPCYTTVPTLQVVVPGNYSWGLPNTAGISTHRDGVPWGFFGSVNDLTKWSGADRDETTAHLHPQVYGSGTGKGTFTYITIHEASHHLGLAHPQDSVTATRGADGAPRYYHGFTWAFNSTAAPTTYSHTETVYSILDQETIARGHLAYYLRWTEEALAEAGLALHAAGTTTLDQLDPDVRALRDQAVAAAARARELFAAFDFVAATFAAQAAWGAAAEYHDHAHGNPVGSQELLRGTGTATDADAAACEEDERVRRIAGDDRVSTAVAISQSVYDAADTVVLARADDYADALVGAPLATSRRGPILLTGRDALPDATAAEIERLGAEAVVLLGGTAAISGGIEDELTAGGRTVERVGGVNRFDTAARIAEVLGDDSGHAFVVEGVHADPERGWPDAVSAAPLAARQGQPILLTAADQLPAETRTALAAADIRTTTVVGGTAAVGDAVHAELERAGHGPTRIGGADRYATSALLLDAALESGLLPHELWLATGRRWPDALTAGPTVAASDRGLLLVDGQDLDASPASRDALEGLASTLLGVCILGGTDAISDDVRSQVADALQR
jgi:hypothetical protein